MNRSYSKKRHIHEANNRLEKRFLNENSVGYFNNWITVDFDAGTLKLNKYLDMENDSSWHSGDEARLTSGTTFKKYNNTLRSTNQQVKIVGDYTGALKTTLNGVSIIYYCKTKRAKVSNSGDFYGENWASDVQRGFNDLCASSVGNIDPSESEWVKQMTNLGNLGTFGGTEWETKMLTGDLAGFIYFGNMVIRKGKISYKDEDGVWQSANIVSGDWSDPSTVKVEGGMSAEDFVNKHKNWKTAKALKKQTTGGGGKSKWDSTCDGESKPFKKMCKGETIRKVQGCLGIKADSYFGSGTETAINNKIGKKFFTNADIDKLCDKDTETTSPTLTGGGGTEEDKIEAMPEQL